mgnify:FL=1
MTTLLRYWRPTLAAVVALLLAGWGYTSLRAYGARKFEAGRQQVLAADALAAAAARAQADQRAADAATASASLHSALDIALPKIEVNTHDAAEKVRTIYLAQPADRSTCVRPAGVQTALDAALRAANAAADRRL